MRSYEERAKDFIAQVFPYIEDCDNPWDAERNISVFNRRYSRKVKVSNGIARIALITSDYVVKFNYDLEECDAVGGCEEEIAVYRQAESDGFGYLFAKTSAYHYQGHTFYIMPRINGVGSKPWSYADDFMTCAERDYCDRIRLSDLHCNNFGFRNGHVCIIDYACTRPASTSSESWS